MSLSHRETDNYNEIRRDDSLRSPWVVLIRLTNLIIIISRSLGGLKFPRDQPTARVNRYLRNRCSGWVVSLSLIGKRIRDKDDSTKDYEDK